MGTEAYRYIAIDLKSFYASVECRCRDLDPLQTHLVVADASRTSKTICLAVSPSLKAYGISGRARLFEVEQAVREINALRRSACGGRTLRGKSFDVRELAADSSLEVDYVVATPRMALYIEYSARIYEIYLRYFSPEDIHVYSIDEVFVDVSTYLHVYDMDAKALVQQVVGEIYRETGITATAGIGTNLYLAKIAMDIMAKHIAPDENGMRVATLDEEAYRRSLWTHRPITDFWRVGAGYARKLAQHGMETMGDVARCSLGADSDYHNEELLFRLFGIQAELLIDHAWGWESCTMADVKAYRPTTNCLSSGQVLMSPYTWEKTRIIVREMTEAMALDLVEKGLVTDQLVLTIGYDRSNLTGEQSDYHGAVTVDRYGRAVPKHAHGTANLDHYTSSAQQMVAALLALYDAIVDASLLVRRVTITANHVLCEEEAPDPYRNRQLDLFTDWDAVEETERAEKAARAREKSMQQAMLSIKKKFGKNAILKGTDLQEGATTMTRNEQIGGHKA